MGILYGDDFPSHMANGACRLWAAFHCALERIPRVSTLRPYLAGPLSRTLYVCEYRRPPLECLWRLRHNTGLLQLHAVVRERIGDLCFKRFCCCEIGIAGRCIALLEFGKPASIKRARQLRIEAQRRAIILDGQLELAHLQMDQAPRIIGRGIFGLDKKRLVAICQRRLQLAEDGSNPAASVPYRL